LTTPDGKILEPNGEKDAPTGTGGLGFGTAPVFLAGISTILGAIMFLRFGYATGHVGLAGVLLIILLGHLVTIPTALAISEIATNRKVEGGGEYYIISRSFGTGIGSVIGLALYMSQAISVAFYMIAFAEAFRPLAGTFENWTGLSFDPRFVSVPAMAVLVLVAIFKGAAIGVKALYVVAVVLGLSLVFFFLGEPLSGAPTVLEPFARVENPELFFVVFAICFPAFTGMTAGVGLSGDLKNPRRSIPLGTLLATFIGIAVYVAIVFKMSLSAPLENLAGDQSIMQRIAIWGPIIPIGLACATISSAIGSILVAPRTLQALGGDRHLPLGRLNAWLERGVGAAGEPRNATILTAGIAFIIVTLGNVNFVARLISMFFMVTYGSLCAISFLEHLAARPDYRPSFRSRWWVSLFGACICLIMMFLMDLLFAVIALLCIAGLYTVVSANRKTKRNDLAALWEALMNQAMRWMHLKLQRRRERASKAPEWRPRVMMVSERTFDRRAHLLLLKWLCNRHGFGTYLHYIKGMLTDETFLESERVKRKIVKMARDQDMNVSMDTIISPSMITALAQSLQIPGISGQSNNAILFEFSRFDPEEEAVRVAEDVLFSANIRHTSMVLRHGDFLFGNRKNIHVWITWSDEETAALMILLCYVLVGHPDWEDADIRLFAALPADMVDEAREKYDRLTREGRLPFSRKNVRFLRIEDRERYREAVARVSSEDDEVGLGFDLDSLREEGAKVFLNHPTLRDALFVYAPRAVKLD